MTRIVQGDGRSGTSIHRGDGGTDADAPLRDGGGGDGGGSSCQVLLLRQMSEGGERMVRNWKQLRAAVTSTARAYGCSVNVYTGHESVRELAKVFAGASAVVGVDGGGMAYMMLMRAGGLVVQILPTQPRIKVSYMELALKLKLRYTAVLHPDAELGTPFGVDVTRVRKMLRLFPPVGAQVGNETNSAWSSGLLRRDTRAELAHTANSSYFKDDDDN